MPSIYIYVSDETMDRLTEAGRERATTPQELAENAVAEAALHWWNSRPAGRSPVQEARQLFDGENWDDPAAEHNRNRRGNY